MGPLTILSTVDTRSWNPSKHQVLGLIVLRNSIILFVLVLLPTQWVVEQNIERVCLCLNVLITSHILAPCIGDANPSPASYTLPSMLGDKIPNRASSACYSMAARSALGGFDTDYAKTPGPARYGVTSAEITKRQAPTYSMQSRNYMPCGKQNIKNNYVYNLLIIIICL